MRYEVREHFGLSLNGRLVAECRWFSDAVKLRGPGRFIVERNHAR